MSKQLHGNSMVSISQQVAQMGYTAHDFHDFNVNDILSGRRIRLSKFHNAMKRIVLPVQQIFC